MIHFKTQSDPQKMHTLVLLQDIKTSVKTFLEGDIINCLIQKMSDGRFAVMATSPGIPFYVVIKSVDNLHSSFNENI